MTGNRYGILSFVYQARRPFHPKRLWDLIHDKFVVMQNVEQVVDEDSSSTTSSSPSDEDFEMVDATSSTSSDPEMDDDDLAGTEYKKDIDPRVSLAPSLETLMNVPTNGQ